MSTNQQEDHALTNWALTTVQAEAASVISEGEGASKQGQKNVLLDPNCVVLHV